MTKIEVSDILIRVELNVSDEVMDKVIPAMMHRISREYGFPSLVLRPEMVRIRVNDEWEYYYE